MVMEYAGSRNTKAYWLCRCECGNEKVIYGNNLRSGRTKSCGCSRRKPKDEVACNALLARYRCMAKSRDYKWMLTKDEFKILTKQNCFYCGRLPEQVCRHSNYNVYIYNGIDRKDNSKGYIPDNVVSCCKRCNRAKDDRSPEEYTAWLRRSYWHLIGNSE